MTRQCIHASLETGDSSGSALVRLPGFPGPGAVLAGGALCLLGFGGGVVCGFGSLHRGLGLGERILGCGQPAAQFRHLPDCPGASPRAICHVFSMPGWFVRPARFTPPAMEWDCP